MPDHLEHIVDITG